MIYTKRMMSEAQKRVAIFVSGTGTNCENIIRYFAGSEVVNIALVVSNKADAPALEKARRLGVPTEVVSKSQLSDSSFMLSLLRERDIHFIVLAGFLLMIPDYLIAAYPRRIINLHPSLLPKFGGKGMYGHRVHEAVKAAGETETGMTVHYVTGECDGGEIIAQYKTAISPEDTPEDIAAKENLLEMRYYPLVIKQVLQNP
jgi:phosphoribosylglycinamide formyltransferase-1